MKPLEGLRVITNLYCNYKCKFCYQKDKSDKVLNLSQLNDIINLYPKQYFNYCTIMGGESTLLPDLSSYIRTSKRASKRVRLTTNGSLLDKDIMLLWKSCGLEGINISIAVISGYSELTGTYPNSIVRIIKKLREAEEIFGVENIRINIPLCKENMGEGQGVRWIVDFFKEENITICEDILGTYSLLDRFEEFGFKELKKTNYGLIFLEYRGRRIGYYTHKDGNYNETDLVVSPLGTFINWGGYCEAVGIRRRT